MGSLVGASIDIRKHGGQEATLTDYAVCVFFMLSWVDFYAPL
jgi:hypothetical protein